MEKEETPKKMEETQKEEKKIEKVTKVKHPGRVESGKRLAEYNRLKKLEAKNKEHKEKVITQEEEPKEESEKPTEIKTSEKPVEVNIYKTSNVVLFLLAGTVGGGIYLYKKWKTNVSAITTKEVKSEPEKSNPFYME